MASGSVQWMEKWGNHQEVYSEWKNEEKYTKFKQCKDVMSPQYIVSEAPIWNMWTGIASIRRKSILWNNVPLDDYDTLLADNTVFPKWMEEFIRVNVLDIKAIILKGRWFCKLHIII